MRDRATGTDIRPFKIDIPQATLDDLQRRLDQAKWPDELPGDGDYGVRQSYIRSLADRWQNGYDWRAVEARINQYPQFTTEIDGQLVHFLHVRSPEPNAFPLIVTHGWPGSIVEFLGIIDALTDPRANGGDPANAFHLVIPSIPGYGFSGPTKEAGWNNYRIAAAWVELMRRLGLRAVRSRRQRRRLDDLAGGRPPGPGARRRGARDPDLLVPLGRSGRVQRHDRGGGQGARDAPVVRQQQDVVQHL